MNSTASADSIASRTYAMESYDERDNKSAVAYSITYNLQAARQDAVRICQALELARGGFVPLHDGPRREDCL